MSAGGLQALVLRRSQFGVQCFRRAGSCLVFNNPERVSFNLLYFITYLKHATISILFINVLLLNRLEHLYGVGVFGQILSKNLWLPCTVWSILLVIIIIVIYPSVVQCSPPGVLGWPIFEVVRHSSVYVFLRKIKKTMGCCHTALVAFECWKVVITRDIVCNLIIILLVVSGHTWTKLLNCSKLNY